ncbi:hypothetical protein AOLI_G00242870 [Acnodon oligacanthus]
MTAMELRERKRNPEEEAAYFSSACKDKDGFDVKYINPDTGRGIFSSVHFDKGDFLLEYRGELITETDALVSATSVLAKKNQMQPEELLPQVPRDATHKVPEEGPFASPMMVTLPPVKERAQIKPEADVLVTTIPLLTEKDQMQPEELHPQFSREATHEYYRLPEATTQLAKISKLLLAMEKGCLPDLQGKSLDDIEIEDEINSTDDSDGSEPENAAMDDAMSVPRQTVCSDSIRAEIKNPGKKTRTLWSKQEVKAVMTHFKSHRTKGKLATMAECQQGKDAEAPVLAGRTLITPVISAGVSSWALYEVSTAPLQCTNGQND